MEGEFAFPINDSRQAEGDAKDTGIAARFVDGEAVSENLPESLAWKGGMNALVVMEEGMGALGNGEVASQIVAVEKAEWEGRVVAQEPGKRRLRECMKDLNLSIQIRAKSPGEVGPSGGVPMVAGGGEFGLRIFNPGTGGNAHGHSQQQNKFRQRPRKGLDRSCHAVAPKGNYIPFISKRSGEDAGDEVVVVGFGDFGAVEAAGFERGNLCT